MGDDDDAAAADDGGFQMPNPRSNTNRIMPWSALVADEIC